MKNPPGLIKIDTGGSASTTMITIDGVMPMVKRATIIIDPTMGENQIKLHCYSRQKNKLLEDGEVQTFCGISKENYEFFTGLMKLMSEIPDADLADQYPSNGIPINVQNMLDFIFCERKRASENEQAPEQP